MDGYQGSPDAPRITLLPLQRLLSVVKDTQGQWERYWLWKELSDKNLPTHGVCGAEKGGRGGLLRGNGIGLPLLIAILTVTSWDRTWVMDWKTAAAR